MELRNLAQIYLLSQMAEFHEIRVIIRLVFSASHSNKWHIKVGIWHKKSFDCFSSVPIQSTNLFSFFVQPKLPIFTNELKGCSLLTLRCCVCNCLWCSPMLWLLSTQTQMSFSTTLQPNLTSTCDKTPAPPVVTKSPVPPKISSFP